MLTVKIDGMEYQMATTLRVAYNVQGQFNHKPYAKVFEGMDDMQLEEQISILYCSFAIANPSAGISKNDFINYYLDHFTLSDVMSQLQTLIEAIMGKPAKASPEEAGKKVSEGN